MDFDESEPRRKMIRLSTYAANAGGAAYCATKCPHAVNPNPHYKELEKQRCCVGCGDAHGYKPREGRENFEKENRFDPKFGYWTPSGCSLPREKRSATCLLFVCRTYVKEGPNPGNITKILEKAFLVRGSDVETR